MPTYEYRCDACGHEFEKFQNMSAGASRKCPSCGLLRLRRLLGTGSGVIFKGSGFYETDYKRRSAEGTNGKSAGAAKDSGGSAPASPEPAAKSDAAPKTEPAKKGSDG